MKKIAVVGLGIAGGILGYKLDKKGYEVTIYNDPNSKSSSRVAAGMFNAIIPRRVTKSWLSDEIFDSLHNFYPVLENELSQSFFHEREVVHIFEYQKEQNDWLAKMGMPGFTNYFDQTGIIQIDNPLVKAPLGAVKINRGGYCDIPAMLDAIKMHFSINGNLKSESLIPSEIIPSEDSICYKGEYFDKIIFCEGIRNSDNSWFSEMPFKFAKGELMKVKIPGLGLKEVLLGGVFLIPIKEDEYFLGSTYEWEFTEVVTTEAAKEKLLKRLSNYVDISNLEIMEQRAGVRPAMKDRRPLIGEHLNHKNIHIFNGFGSKAVSLAPYFADHYIDFLEGKAELNPEADVSRFYE